MVTDCDRQDSRPNRFFPGMDIGPSGVYGPWALQHLKQGTRFLKPAPDGMIYFVVFLLARSNTVRRCTLRLESL